MLYFITEGNNVRIKDGDNNFRLLHNTSKCIDWTVYASTIDLSIDEVTFDQMNPSDIYFDGVASANAAGVVASLKAMFSNLGSSAKVYRALLTQSGTDAPTAIVLENTLAGSIIWSRSGVGDYQGTLIGSFTQNKTHISGGLISVSPDDSAISIIKIEYGSEDSVQVNSTYTELNPVSVVRSDGFTNLSIKILVYP